MMKGQRARNTVSSANDNAANGVDVSDMGENAAAVGMGLEGETVVADNAAGAANAPIAPVSAEQQAANEAHARTTGC